MGHASILVFMGKPTWIRRNERYQWGNWSHEIRLSWQKWTWRHMDKCLDTYVNLSMHWYCRTSCAQSLFLSVFEIQIEQRTIVLALNVTLINWLIDWLINTADYRWRIFSVLQINWKLLCGSFFIIYSVKWLAHKIVRRQRSTILGPFC